MLRRKEANGTLQVSEETREADMKSILEGGNFQFLRHVCCKMNEGEEVEVRTSEQEADDEGPETNSQGSKRSGWCDLVAEPESLTRRRYLGIVGMPQDPRAQASWGPSFSGRRISRRNRVKCRRVWEWSGYDSKAEHWLFERENRVRAATGNMEIGRSKGDKVWEWTNYDEKAEQEEAKRKENQILRDLDLDLQITGPDSIAWMFGGMSLSSNGERRRPLAEPSSWKL